MKKQMKNIVAVMFISAFFCASALSTVAMSNVQNFNVNLGDQDFLLINSTGVEIYALYVSPHNSDQWGDDILGADTLFDGEDLLIYFPSKTKQKYWDLRIEDEEGNYLEWDKLNLLKISSVELLYRKGQTTAILN